MANEFEIKASSAEEAITRIKSENQFGEDFDFQVEELARPKSILGIIATKGSYKVTVVKNLSNGIRKRVEKILELMDINVNISVEKGDKNNYSIKLNGTDNGILIGKKGKTLNSFEYLINSMVKEAKIDVDVEEFKEKRKETLIDLSRKMADKVIKTGKAIKLNPMPPAERKIIHSVLNEYDNIETLSEGKDPNRYIVIKLKKKDGER